MLRIASEGRTNDEVSVFEGGIHVCVSSAIIKFLLKHSLYFYQTLQLMHISNVYK